MSIKYFVRTTGHRKLDQSYGQVEYKLLCYNTGNPIDDFIQSLYDISDYDSVLLEDDLILCRNFNIEVNGVLSKYPGRIVNFYSSPDLFVETSESPVIIYNQCTFYPKNISKKIADIMVTKPRILNSEFFDYKRYSRLETIALKDLSEKIVQYRPPLVQHLALSTSINSNGRPYRSTRSRYFLDYLNNLGIEYKDAEKYSYELLSEMKNNFKEIDAHPERYFN